MEMFLRRFPYAAIRQHPHGLLKKSVTTSSNHFDIQLYQIKFRHPDRPVKFSQVQRKPCYYNMRRENFPLQHIIEQAFHRTVRNNGERSAFLCVCFTASISDAAPACQNSEHVYAFIERLFPFRPKIGFEQSYAFFPRISIPYGKK